jgi:RNA polymerase sigma-B factor
LYDEAVTLNMPLARSLATRYRGRGIALADLEQVAYYGLIKAVRGFALDRGQDFRSYAVPTIRGELRRHFRDAGWVVRPPRRLQELQPRVWEAEEQLTQRLHRSPRPSEIAAHLEVAEDEVLEALSTDGCFVPASLDMPTTDGDGPVLADRRGDIDLGYDRAEARILLGPAVRRLKARDRRIIEMRFFEGLTQQKIGEEIGVTQMQVSRLLTRILGDLRKTIQPVGA